MHGTVLEIAQFKLASGVDPAALVLCSADLEAALSATPGFVGRRLGRADTTWVDVVEWTSEAAAQAAMTSVGGTPAGAAYFALIDMNSVQMQHFNLVS